MSDNTNRHTGRRVAGIVCAALLSTLATPALAGPADAAGTAPAVSGVVVVAPGWHCRVLPFLC